MSTMSIPPNKLLMLAALAIGGYWFMTKGRAGAATRPSTPRPAGPGTPIGLRPTPSPAGVYRQNDSNLWGAIAGILNGAGGAQRPPSPGPGSGGSWGATGDADVMPGYGSSSNDGIPANPPFDDVYDFSRENWY
jgi:hypothetical protein